jgi:hypothetical protein
LASASDRRSTSTSRLSTLVVETRSMPSCSRVGRVRSVCPDMSVALHSRHRAVSPEIVTVLRRASTPVRRAVDDVTQPVP